MTELFIGLMSGTSRDGLDAVLVELDDTICALRAATTTPFPEDLAGDLAALVRKARIELRALGTLSTQFGEFAADCVLALIETATVDSADIRAIGFSGHTIFHQPDPPSAFTLQLGNPNVVAARTGITTVADLRGMDVAMGGQGAPLLPAFHAWRFANPTEARAAINIGGIANITLLIPNQPVTGFDSGPGNTLMDYWNRKHGRGRFDPDGAWATSGKVVAALLQTLKGDPYFAKVAPKSTGLEHFNPTWLSATLDRHRTVEPADVQATLLELTASTIIDALEPHRRDVERLILCGGGAYNGALVRRLTALAAPAEVVSSTAHGIAPEWVEAAGFAWLARARLAGQPGNLPSVTGAREPVQLGGVYSGHKPRA
jgi:anhydro-N-acetylmuramic acid kinase